MKPFVIAFLMLLAAGCSASCPPPSARTEYSRSEGRMYSADVIELAGVIPVLCEGLGLTIEGAQQSPERHEWACKSLSGVPVKLEVIAIVKGRSLVRTTLRGDRDIARELQREIWNGLNAAFRSYKN